MLVAEKLLRAKRVAELLDITPEQVYRMAQERLLPGIRVGRQWRFDESSLLEWMQNGGAGSWRRPLNS
jgi:excisionase family DNA binding protein